MLSARVTAPTTTVATGLQPLGLGTPRDGLLYVPTSYQPDQPAPGTFNVEITAREDSWSSIAVDGKPVFEGTLIAPAERLLPAQKLVVIRAGNIGGLEFAF